MSVGCAPFGMVKVWQSLAPMWLRLLTCSASGTLKDVDLASRRALRSRVPQPTKMVLRW